MTAGLGSGLCERVVARLGQRREASDERGFTLIETLITVWILGAVMVTFCGAMFTMVHASSLQQQRALGETELRHLAEAVRSEPYIPCEEVAGVAGTYQSSLASHGYTAAAGVSNATVGISQSGGVTAGYWDKNQDLWNTILLTPPGPKDVAVTFTTIANVDSQTQFSINFASLVHSPTPYPGLPCTSGQIWDYGAQKLTLSLNVQGVAYTEDIVKRDTSTNTNSSY